MCRIFLKFIEPSHNVKVLYQLKVFPLAGKNVFLITYQRVCSLLAMDIYISILKKMVFQGFFSKEIGSMQNHEHSKNPLHD